MAGEFTTFFDRLATDAMLDNVELMLMLVVADNKSICGFDFMNHPEPDPEVEAAIDGADIEVLTL